MKMSDTKDEITFTFPRFAKRSNPYDDEGDYGEYPVFTGLIMKHKNGLVEMGFAYTIDMDYKGKSDQTGGFAVMWDGDEKSFVEECKRLNLALDEINL